MALSTGLHHRRVPFAVAFLIFIVIATKAIVSSPEIMLEWFSLDLGVRFFLAFMLIMALLPFVLSPIMPKRFTSKLVLELDCTAEKAFDTLVEDPRKCPMTGTEFNAIAASVDDADEKRRPLKWKEEIRKAGRPEVFSIEQTFQAPKKGKNGHVVRTSKHATNPVESEWTYEIEALDNRRCRITLEGYTVVKDGAWHTPTPLLRMMIWMEGTKKGMYGHLSMLADATGAKRTWVSH